MITVKYIPNIFKNEGRETCYILYAPEKTLQDYIFESKFNSENCRIVVAGERVADLSVVIKDGGEIIITPDIKDIVSAIYALASAIWAAALAHPFIAWGIILSVSYSLYSALSMRTARQPSFGLTPNGGLDDSSPTYGWDGIASTQDVGVPIGIVYGQHRVGGNIINQYVRTDGDKEYLNVLLALSEGEIDSISDLEINQNPSANFASVTQTYRYGTNSQTQIPAFNDSHSLQSMNVQLTKDSAYTYTTVADDITAFEVQIEFTGGLYQQGSSGSVEPWTVSLKVEYRVHGDGDYTELGTYDVSDESRTDVRRVYRKESLTAGQYDIKITRTSDNSSLSPLKQGDSYLKQVDEITQDEPLVYPNLALAGIEALATDQLNGSTPNFTLLVKGKKVRVPDVQYGGSATLWEDYYYDPASSQYKLLSNSAACTWDGSTFIDAFSANPIWCLRDLLTNTRYGLGDYITTAMIDDTQLLEMAKYCDERTSDGAASYEKRFRLDVVIDGATRAIDLVNQLCSTFRCFVFYTNGTIKLKIDKADTPVQMFGMGNIIKDTFVQSWKSIKEIPNVVEIQFMDEDKNYAQETVAVFDEVSIAAGEPIRKKQLRLFCTRTSQCIREGKYLLNVAKHIDRTVTLSAGIDAIACQAGDLVNISHDVPQWGYSGRVQASSTTTLVKLDRTVTVEAGKTYKVRVRFADDTQEEKTVSDSAGTYTQVNVSSAFSQAPAAFDVYSFGEDTYVVAPYRVVGIKRTGASDVELICLEYNASVYDTDTIYLPDNNYSDLTDTVPIVTDLDLTEGAAVLPDGTVNSLIEVWFAKPNDNGYRNKYLFAKIYLSRDAGASYQLVGQTYGNSYVIDSDFVKSSTYYVKVLTVSSNGLEDKLSNAPSDSITIAGKTSKPDNVSTFSYAWGNELVLSWSANDDVDLAGYEIRDEDANFGTDDAHLIYKGLATRKVLYPASRSIGSYYIRAYNTSGVYSNASASITPANSAPSAPTGLGSDVLFNVARLYWTDVADADVKHYEVYKSDTDAWAGEETLIGKVTGRAFTFDSKSPRSGAVDSATDTTVVDDNLIGLGDDYFNGDIITITAGTGLGQERTISDFTDATGTVTVSAAWDTNPDSTSKFMINDKCYIKVRGVDSYGVGTFSSSSAVLFDALDENAIGDNVITARKIYVACLSALSANMGCLTSGVIQGGTIQTGSGGARTVFSSSELRSYDSTHS